MITVLERLQSLPKKELIAGVYFRDDDCCAIGACLRDHRGAVLDGDGYNRLNVMALRLRTGMGALIDGIAVPDVMELAYLQSVNDSVGDTPAERYDLVLRTATLVAAGKWTFREARVASCNGPFAEALAKREAL